MKSINESAKIEQLMTLMGTMTPEQLKDVGDIARETRLKQVENNQKIQSRDMVLLKKEIQSMRETTEVLKEGLKKITEETDNITKTFMTNSKEKRDCEKYMHRLIYNELGKDSIRDQLFHGLLTRSCKNHLVNTFPNVSSFNWLRVDDIDIILGITKTFLSSKNIHKLMRKQAQKIYKEKEKNKVKNISSQKLRQYELLEVLLEEVGYDNSLI